MGRVSPMLVLNPITVIEMTLPFLSLSIFQYSPVSWRQSSKNCFPWILFKLLFNKNIFLLPPATKRTCILIVSAESSTGVSSLSCGFNVVDEVRGQPGFFIHK